MALKHGLSRILAAIGVVVVVSGCNGKEEAVPGPVTDGTCAHIGVEVVSCAAVPIGPFAEGFSGDSNNIYGRLAFSTGFGENNAVLTGRDARTLWDAVKTAFVTTEAKTIIVTVTPKLGDVKLTQTVVALLEYSDASGQPQWTSKLDRLVETPWRVMSSDATFSFEIGYAVSEESASKIQETWSSTAAFIPPVSPEVIAAKAAVDTIVSAAQPMIEAFLKATGAKITTAVRDSVKPLAGTRQVTYVFGPAKSPTIRMTASVLYRSSMFKGPVPAVGNLAQPSAGLDDAESIKLTDGTIALHKAQADNKTLILAASHRTTRGRQEVQNVCNDIRAYLQDEKKGVELNKLDAAILTARIFSDEPILTDTIPEGMRKPCLTQIAAEVAKAGITLEPYDSALEAPVSTASTTEFFKLVKSMHQGDTTGALSVDGMNLVAPATLVNLITGSQIRDASQTTMIRELVALGITDFGCFTTGKVEGESVNAVRIALANGPQGARYAFEFWGKMTPNSNRSVDVDYVVIRKPVPTDYDPRNPNCEKFR